jgi:hypothetical protein
MEFNMVPPINADDLRLKSGRTIGQFRKLATKIKKAQRIPFSQALNQSISEFNLSGGWQSLIQHAKWLTKGSDAAPPALPSASSTLVLGSHPVLNRIASMLWEDSLLYDYEVCDIVIDCTGNPLTYGHMYSHLEEKEPFRPFRAIDLSTQSLTGVRFAMDDASLVSLAYAVTNGKKLNYEDIVGYIKGLPDHGLTEEAVQQIEASLQHGLFRLLDQDGGHGLGHFHLFNTQSTVLFSLANSMKCSDEYNQLLVQILRIVEFESERCEFRRYRVTIIQPNERMDMPSDIIQSLYDNEKVQMNIVSRYPIRETAEPSWITPLVDESEVLFTMSAYESEVPDSLYCLTPQLTSLKGVEGSIVNGALFNYGELVDVNYHFALRSVSKPTPVMPISDIRENSSKY